MISESEITYDVFISDPIPQAVATLLPNGDHPMWSPMSSTLIYGPTEAVLIDPPLTIKQTEALADWVESFGKKLSYIYITHGPWRSLVRHQAADRALPRRERLRDRGYARSDAAECVGWGAWRVLDNAVP